MKKVVIAGGSGFLGQTLVRYFQKLGWKVVVLTRVPKRDEDVWWDGRTAGAWKLELEGAEAVINLSGRSVNCRYTPSNRDEIRRSRIDSTRVIGHVVAESSRPPRVWLNSSTATIYQHTFGEPHDEKGAIGSHPEADDEFSVEVAKEWEGAFNEAITPQTRKVALRAAMVLGHGANSVFPTLRRLARFGLGGPMGSGKQFVSWIHAKDFCRAIQWIIEHSEIHGPINLAAPRPVTNQEMMRALRQVVGVPFGLPASRWMLAIGAIFLRTEIELIIKSRRVIPGRLLDSGFQFEFTTIRQAFEDLARRYDATSLEGPA